MLPVLAPVGGSVTAFTPGMTALVHAEVPFTGRDPGIETVVLNLPPTVVDLLGDPGGLTDWGCFGSRSETVAVVLRRALSVEVGR